MNETPPPSYPRASSDRSPSLVIISGLTTTAIALFVVYLLATRADDFNVMGWYANYVLPVGAILVGLGASIGYGLASWKTGLKITSKLLWLMLAFQLAAYFAAQYIEFRAQDWLHHDGTPVGFLEYYDVSARSFAWKQDNGSNGTPLGMWGYFFKLLEIAGFVGGSLAIPLGLKTAPYCATCQLYKRKQMLTYVPASLPVKKIKKKDVEAQAAHNAEQKQANEDGRALAQKLVLLATENKPDLFQEEVRPLTAKQKDTLKLDLRIQMQMVHCPRCHAGNIITSLLMGQGKHMKTFPLSDTVVPPDFVQFTRKK